MHLKFLLVEYVELWYHKTCATAICNMQKSMQTIKYEHKFSVHSSVVKIIVSQIHT